jgi:RND family efflux transporter MFP subunit
MLAIWASKKILFSLALAGLNAVIATWFWRRGNLSTQDRINHMTRLLARTLSLSLLLTIGCREANVYQEPPPPTVRVASPVVQDVTNYVEETATTEAVAKVEVRARVEGFVDAVLFEPGSNVTEGDLLYQIEPELYEARVAAANADLEVEKVKLKEAEAEKIRYEELAATNAVSESERLEAETAFGAAQAATLQAEALLKQAQIDLQYTKIVAPISGRVGKTLIKEGNLVGGSEPTLLTTVISYDPIYANFNISERMLLKLVDGQRRTNGGEIDKESIAIFLRRETDDGFPFKGHFDYADLAVDQSTGTFLIRGIFPNPAQKIVPGLFVTVRLPIGTQENATLIPERAIAEDQAGEYVFVVNSENEVDRRAVTSGQRVGELIVVTSGLTASDTVVVDGLQRARPGAKVNPTRIQLSTGESESQTVQSSGLKPPQPDAGVSPDPSGTEASEVQFGDVQSSDVETEDQAAGVPAGASES